MVLKTYIHELRGQMNGGDSTGSWRTFHYAKRNGNLYPFLMLFRIVECLRKGEPLDQNVYEGCFWSAVAPLSEKSNKEDGMPQDFPDFTRGNWKTTKPLGIIA